MVITDRFLKARNPFSSSLISSLKLYLPKRLMCSKDAGEIWSKSSSLTSYPSSLSSLTWRPRGFLEYKRCSKPLQYWGQRHILGKRTLLLDIQGKKWLTNWLDFRNLFATKQKPSYREVQSSCMPI